MVSCVYIFIGPPGSGKGSLSSSCEKEFGWKRLSTGDLCRKHISDKTKIGMEIDFSLKSGILVSDNLVTDMVADWVTRLPGEVQAVILDGYPRTVGQAVLFDELIRTRFRSLTLRVIKLSISDESVISRLLNRYICGNTFCQHVYSLVKDSLLAPQVAMTCDVCASRLVKRKDDELGAIQERLRVYYQHAQELTDFYLKAGYPITEFNVERPLREVFEKFKKLMCLNGV